MSILDKIIASKKKEIAQKQTSVSSENLCKIMHQSSASNKGFVKKLSNSNFPAVIAEIKKASPSKGDFAPDLDIVVTAKDYVENGAACLSVLTDEPFFRGKLEFIAQIKKAVDNDVPILRKDFIIDVYQVWETVVSGADALLLIVAALDDSTMQSLAKESLSLGLDIIVEVHNESELVRAVDLIQALAKTYPEVATKVALGINNRDLHSFVTDLSVTIKLISHAKAKLFTEESKIKFSDICWISESGLGSAADLCHLKQSGVKNFLIGESLIKSGAPGEALSLLIEQASK